MKKTLLNNKRYKAYRLALILFGFGGSHLESFAQTKVDPESRISTLDALLQDEPESASGKFSLSLRSGYAQYQDLQLPIATDTFSFEPTSTRVDGFRSEFTTSIHTGIPIGALASYKASETQKDTIEIDLDILHITSSRGNKETNSATYFRTGLNSRYTYKAFQTTSLGKPAVFAEAGLQRARYLNISTGHFIDSFIPKVGGELSSDNNKFVSKLTLGWSPLNSFKYYPGTVGSATELKDTEVTTASLNWASRYKIFDDIWVEFTYDYEQIDLTYKSASGYRRFGLVEADEEILSRNITLSTASYLFGINKFF